MLDRRKEQLATSDKGVILIRKIILNAIQAVQDHQTPKGVLPADQAHALMTIDSFTGMRAKGSGEMRLRRYLELTLTALVMLGVSEPRRRSRADADLVQRDQRRHVVAVGCAGRRLLQARRTRHRAALHRRRLAADSVNAQRRRAVCLRPVGAGDQRFVARFGSWS